MGLTMLDISTDIPQKTKATRITRNKLILYCPITMILSLISASMLYRYMINKQKNDALMESCICAISHIAFGVEWWYNGCVSKGGHCTLGSTLRVLC